MVQFLYCLCLSFKYYRNFFQRSDPLRFIQSKDTSVSINHFCWKRNLRKEIDFFFLFVKFSSNKANVMVGNQHLIFLNLTNKPTRWAVRSVAIIKKQKFP